MSDMTLNQFLLFAISGPGAAALLSLAVDYIPYLRAWVDSLAYDAKRLFFLATSFAIPLAATGGMIALGQATPEPETWWRAVFAGALGYAASNVTHLANRVVTRAMGVNVRTVER